LKDSRLIISKADVEDVKASSHNEITFKVHGKQHNLFAETKAARDGWLLAFHEKVAEAKALKDEIHSKEGFKEAVEKLTCKFPSNGFMDVIGIFAFVADISFVLLGRFHTLVDHTLITSSYSQASSSCRSCCQNTRCRTKEEHRLQG
jgi:hypothetical protein